MLLLHPATVLNLCIGYYSFYVDYLVCVQNTMISENRDNFTSSFTNGGILFPFLAYLPWLQPPVEC